MSADTRVDFYHLSSDQAPARLLFVCRLTDKAYRQGLRSLVCVPDAGEAGMLDDLMWTFSDGGFLPHTREPEETGTPVLISATSAQASSQAYDLLVNLGTEIAVDPAGFSRIAEVITTAPDSLQPGRKRYLHYKNAGFPLHYHEISA